MNSCTGITWTNTWIFLVLSFHSSGVGHSKTLGPIWIGITENVHECKFYMYIKIGSRMKSSCWYLCLKVSAATFGEGCISLTHIHIIKPQWAKWMWRLYRINQTRPQANIPVVLQWRHNGRGSVSNHQPHDCLLNRLIRRRSKKKSKPRVTGLCAGSSSVTGEFPAQSASNAENVSIWWRHHGLKTVPAFCFGWTLSFVILDWELCITEKSTNNTFFVCSDNINLVHSTLPSL